jgi:hypothetical protein
MYDVNEMIKQAYAYGASVALQEAGFAPAQADAAAIRLTLEKTAEEDEGGMSGLTGALLGGGAGALLGAGGGALAGRMQRSNLLRKLLDVGATPHNAPMVPTGGGMDSRKLKALQEAAQLTRGEKAQNKLFDMLANTKSQGSLLAPHGAMGQLGGSAALGAGAGAGLGALGGGLYGGLTD